MLVDRPVDVAPDPGDLDVGLVDEPAVTGTVPARPGRVDQQRGEALHPPVDGHVVDLDATLGQQLLEVAVRQPVPQVPADRQQDHLRREPEPSKRSRLSLRTAATEPSGAGYEPNPIRQRNSAHAPTVFKNCESFSAVATLETRRAACPH